MKILVISTSVRKERNSHNVALLVQNIASSKPSTEVEVFDLKKAAFPLFDERYAFMDDVPAEAESLVQKVKAADIIIPIIPEYNGSYPASFKNIFDFISGGWRDKIVGVVTASTGRQGGAQAMQRTWMDFTKVGAIVVGRGVYAAEINNNVTPEGTSSIDWLNEGISKYVDRLIDFASRS